MRQSRAVLDVVEVEVVADVGERGVYARLEIPGGVAALGHGGRDQAAPALAREHAGTKRLLVPALERLLAESGDCLSMRGVAREILLLEGIGGKVVELLRVGRAANVFAGAAADHQQRCHRALAAI